MLKYNSHTGGPWKFSNKYERADLSEYIGLCDWCKDYHINHDPKDTGDMLYRWNIAVYQLDSIPGLLASSGGKNFDALEWAEASASVLVHSTAAFEVALGGNVYSVAWLKMVREPLSNYNLRLSQPSQRGGLYGVITHCLPGVTKQLLYKAMGRQKRFNEFKLAELASAFLANVIDLVALNHCCYDVESAVTLVTDKLNNLELKSH